MWWKMRMLMKIEDDKGGSGNGKKPDPPDDDELEERVGKHVAKAVNGAVRDYMKRGAFKEELAASVKETVAPMFDELKTIVGGGAGGDKGKGAGGDDEKNRGAGGGGALPPDVQKRLDDQERTIKRLSDESTRANAERDAAKKRNDEAEERGILATALKKAGVSEDRIDGAAALLYHERKRVIRDKDGKVRFALPKEGYVDEVDVEMGVAEWAKTSEGKGYLPPTQVQGGGARGGAPPVRRGEEPSEAQLMDALGRSLLGQKVDIG